jgi:hypothetical protein
MPRQNSTPNATEAVEDAGHQTLRESNQLHLGLGLLKDLVACVKRVPLSRLAPLSDDEVLVLLSLCKIMKNTFEESRLPVPSWLVDSYALAEREIPERERQRIVELDRKIAENEASSRQLEQERQTLAASRRKYDEPDHSGGR